MEQIVERMLERINNKIRYANANYTVWNDAHTRRMAEIDGMIDMLEIVTGKKYVVSESELKEV